MRSRAGTASTSCSRAQGRKSRSRAGAGSRSSRRKTCANRAGRARAPGEGARPPDDYTMTYLLPPLAPRILQEYHHLIANTQTCTRSSGFRHSRSAPPRHRLHFGTSHALLGPDRPVEFQTRGSQTIRPGFYGRGRRPIEIRRRVAGSSQPERENGDMGEHPTGPAEARK